MNSASKNIIATLGPQGTCSSQAARYFIDNFLEYGEVNLYATFEEGIELLKKKEVDYVVIPSAYRRIADIIFDDLEFIEIQNVFKFPTPRLVLASKNKNTEIKRLATHSSPYSLLKTDFSDTKFVEAKSNSDAAEIVLNNQADACITTIICAENNRFYVIRDFGVIQMGWNVFIRKKRC